MLAKAFASEWQSAGRKQDAQNTLKTRDAILVSGSDSLRDATVEMVEMAVVLWAGPKGLRGLILLGLSYFFGKNGVFFSS